jgi:predicted permease
MALAFGVWSMAEARNSDPAAGPGIIIIGTVIRIIVIAVIVAVVLYAGGFGGSGPAPGDPTPQITN